MRHFINKIKAILILISFFVLVAGAAYADKSPITNKYGGFIFSEDIPHTLFFFKKISQSDSFELRKALRNHDINTIVLSSPGGLVFEGLQMAGIIHDKKINTYIPKNGSCVSACSFMFFAGSQRGSAGNLGVHQFYSKDGNNSDEVSQTEKKAQFTVSEIIGFLNEFNTPAFVFERMFQQSEMYFFNKEELDKLTTQAPEEFIEVNKIESFAKNYSLVNSKLISEFTEEKVPTKKDKDTGFVSTKLIQAELNRVGCNLGAVDGIVGPASIRAMTRYTNIAGISYDERLFTSAKFFYEIRKVPKGFCPKLKVVEKVKTIRKRQAIFGEMEGQWVIDGVCEGKYKLTGAISIKFKKKSLLLGRQHSVIAKLDGDYYNGTYEGGYSEQGSRASLVLANRAKSNPFKVIGLPYLRQVETEERGWAICGSSDALAFNANQCYACIWAE